MNGVVGQDHTRPLSVIIVNDPAEPKPLVMVQVWCGLIVCIIVVRTK